MKSKLKPTKEMTKLQDKINKLADKIAEHQKTLGKDKTLINKHGKNKKHQKLTVGKVQKLDIGIPNKPTGIVLVITKIDKKNKIIYFKYEPKEKK